MLLLAIDTSAPTGSVAVLRDGRLLGAVSTAADEAYSSRLFRQLDFLLHELKLEIRQFDVFAVAAGPGSFTGLRVGITAVKGWAEVFGKPVVAVSGLEAVAAQSKSAAPLIAAVMDARRGQVYAALFCRDGKRLVRCGGDERVCELGEFLSDVVEQSAGKDVQFVSPDAEIIEDALTTAELSQTAILKPVERVSPALAPIIGELATARAKRGEVTDALRLDANYIRRSDAELLWKGP